MDLAGASRMKQIEWLCPLPNARLRDLQLSNLASIRLRTALGVRAAHANGMQATLSDGERRTNAKLVIVGKIDYISDAHRPARWLAHLREVREGGSRVVIDYSDHHLAIDSPAARFYEEALPLANRVVCSSQTLAGYLSEYLNCQRTIIEDPIEVGISAPKERASETLTAFWFGHASNLPYLIAYLRNDLIVKRPFRLILMTNAYPLSQKFIDQLNCSALKSLKIEVVPWSLDDMMNVAALSDICLLPAGLNDPRKHGASSNRLLTALALGLPVAADLLPSYQPYISYFVPIRSNEINSLVDDPTNYHQQVKEAQKVILKKFTKTQLAKEWGELIDAEMRASTEAPAITSPARQPSPETPILQVLIITYNQENLCQRVIKNIESFVSDDVGVLVQDDCSTDHTYNTLATHFENHPRVKIYRNNSNLGPGRNCASLISRATSEFVLIYGGDDFIVPKQLNEAIMLLKNKPLDVGVFNCAHASLGVIDHVIFEKPKTTDNLNIFLRNIQFTEEKDFNEKEFFKQIATVPGALWGQGVLFRTSLLHQTQISLIKSELDDWELFHNLAVYAQNQIVRVKFFKQVITLLAVSENSRGSDIGAQLTRQINAVLNHWDVAYRKTALMNLLEKKLKQFRSSSLGADEVFTLLKNSISKVSG